MIKTMRFVIAGLMVVVLGTSLSFGEELTKDFSKIPETGVVTMVDLGAKKCIPCKMMAPIMVKLEKAYQGSAAIVFIDVWENNDQAKRFGINGIPTQIFFDKQGKEVFRHTGFFDEESIKKQLTQMGVQEPKEKQEG